MHSIKSQCNSPFEILSSQYLEVHSVETFNMIHVVTALSAFTTAVTILFARGEGGMDCKFTKQSQQGLFVLDIELVMIKWQMSEIVPSMSQSHFNGVWSVQ